MSWNTREIHVGAVFASLLITCLSILFPDTLNDDAFTYFRTAEIYLTEGSRAAFSYYPWATYSILIGYISKTAQIDLITASLILNGTFYAILVFSFLKIVSEMDNNPRVAALAVLTILAFPQLNEYRNFVIRDSGFWAFSLLGVWQFVSYCYSYKKISGFFFCLAFLVAFAFRIEAIVYMLVLPLTVLANQNLKIKEKSIALANLYLLVLSTIVVALVIGALSVGSIIDLTGQFASTYLPFVKATFSPSGSDSLSLRQGFFNEQANMYSHSQTILVLWVGLSSVALIALFKSIGLPYLSILTYGLWHRRKFGIKGQLYYPLIGYLIISLIILFSFTFLTRFTTGRYTIALCLGCLLLIPIVLDRAYERGDSIRQRTKFVRILTLVFIYCAIDAYYSFGIRKTFIADSVHWLNLQLLESEELVTNNKAIAYFSGRVEHYDTVPQSITTDQIATAEPGTVFAIERKVGDGNVFNSRTARISLKLLAVFPSEENQRITIYSKNYMENIE